jgi:hypothetical protein
MKFLLIRFSGRAAVLQPHIDVSGCEDIMLPSFVNADFIDQHPKFSRWPDAGGQVLV